MSESFDIPKSFKIKEIVRNSTQVVTLVFEGTLNSSPGQFVMLWLPEVDEKPISISLDSPEKNEIHLSIADVGEVTHKFCEGMKIGDSLGMRGPYGTSFKLQVSSCKTQGLETPLRGQGGVVLLEKGEKLAELGGLKPQGELTTKTNQSKNTPQPPEINSGQAPQGGLNTNYQLKTKIALVGGGCGCAPLRFLAYEARHKKIEVDYYIGVRTKDLVLFEEEMQSIGCNVFVSTDDGTHGEQGFVTQQLAENLMQNKVDTICTCGPEMMMKIVADLAKKHEIPAQISMERYMKCGFGICGQCCLDDSGLRLCKEGPIISGEKALASKEFGTYHRDKMGIKHSF